MYGDSPPAPKAGESLMSKNSCIYCKGVTDPHCTTSGCAWERCGECGAVIWSEAGRAMHRGRSVPWPYSWPD
jgi:hypothetical protein